MTNLDINKINLQKRKTIIDNILQDITNECFGAYNIHAVVSLFGVSNYFNNNIHEVHGINVFFDVNKPDRNDLSLKFDLEGNLLYADNVHREYLFTINDLSKLIENNSNDLNLLNVHKYPELKELYYKNRN